MRRITVWSLSTLSALVLLFSYRTSTAGAGGSTAALAAPAPSATSSSTASPTPSSSSSADPSASSTPSSSATSSASGSSGSGTYTGDSVQTRWGPVQVQVTVADGKVTDVTAVTYPDGNRRDQEINEVALPELHDEVVAAQSAQIDSVSGATVTSDGYISSLQSALDAAHLS